MFTFRACCNREADPEVDFSTVFCALCSMALGFCICFQAFWK